MVAQVVVGAGDDSRREFGEGDACSAGEELAASVASIAVGGHEVFAVEVEGAPVLHGEDGDLLPVGLGGVHGVADACCGVEVEGHVLQAEAAAAVEHAVEEEDVVVGRVHGGGPEVVAHLEEAEYLAACEAHGVEEVLVLVEGEHVGDVGHARGDGGVEGEGCREGYFSSLTDFELEVVDEVYEGRGSEEGVALVHRGLKHSHVLLHVGIHGVALAGEPVFGADFVGARLLEFAGVQDASFGADAEDAFAAPLQPDVHLADVGSGAGGSDAEYAVAVGRGYSLHVPSVVVAVEYEVES